MNEFKNSTWPGWETTRMIGRGSFGVVYEIQRKMFDEVEQAALKVISIPQSTSDIADLYSDGYDDDSIAETFREYLKSIVAEYSLMRKMNGSSNIVNCDDVRYIRHDDGIGWDVFIKMELLTPLIDTLSNGVSEDVVVRIARDICEALVLCSKHGIVHRDIKPQNIFVSANGDYKLGDFGIAKTVEKTMGGTKIGTYKYMAPEVYNNQPYGAAADIYSLGLVLYWLLNERRMPFMPLPPAKLKVGMDEDARYRRMNGEQIPAPAHGSEELKRIVLKACAYTPSERYSSAQAMLEDLNKLVGKENIPITVYADQPEEDLIEGPVLEDKTVGVRKPNSKPATNSPAGAEKPKKIGGKTKRIAAIVISCVAVVVFIALFFAVLVPASNYNKAVALMDAGQYKEALDAFRELGDYQDAKTQTIRLLEKITERKTVAAGDDHSAGLRMDGTVVAVGNNYIGQCDVSDWTDIVAVAVGYSHTVGLKADGTVAAVGSNYYGECDVSGWADIGAVTAGDTHTVGLKADGTVVAVGNNYIGQCDVSDWTDIVAVTAGRGNTIGLKANGTVVAVGENYYGQCDVSDWTDIVAVAVGYSHTVGLKADGTVVTVGDNSSGQCNAFGWTDIKLPE